MQEDNQPTQEQPPVVPTGPTAPDVAPAAQPRRGPSRTLLTILGAALVLLLIVGGLFAALLHANADTTPSAGTILTSASKAKLQDASFIFTGQAKLNLGGAGQGTSVDLNGNGTFTNSPARIQASATVPFLGTQNTIDLITDTDALYVRAPGLLGLLNGGSSTTADQKWIKVPLGTSTTASTSFSDFYQEVQNPTLVSGTETVNGKAVWHVRGTVGVGVDSKTPGAAATATAVTQKAGITGASDTVDLWLTKDNYYPAKIELQASGSGTVPTGTATTGTGGLGDAQVNFTGTATFANWNSGITITPPPASDVTTFPGITGGSGGFPFPGLTPTPAPSA